MVEAAQTSRSGRRPGAWRAWFEVVAVLLLSFLGLVAGALTGWVPASPILGTLFAVAGATLFLRREGVSWQALGFARRMPAGKFLFFTTVTLVAVFVVTSFLVTPALRLAGAPPLDVSVLAALIEGNLANYLVFLLPISWGTAAVGEELIARGFLQYRFEQLGGPVLAVLLQASLFALAHSYQGITGVINIFFLALIFGAVYYRCGRNLWPLIAAHGLIDTVGMTLLFLGRTDLLLGT